MLLDANALMIPSQFRVDLFTELGNLIGAYEPIILTDVLNELRGLARGKGKAGSAARGALLWAERCLEVESGCAEGTVDERIIRYAREHNCMVLTNDRKLRQELLSLGISVVTLKQRKRLDLLRR